jgi:hypothetical protein
MEEGLLHANGCEILRFMPSLLVEFGLLDVARVAASPVAPRNIDAHHLERDRETHRAHWTRADAAQIDGRTRRKILLPIPDDPLKYSRLRVPLARAPPR